MKAALHTNDTKGYMMRRSASWQRQLQMRQSLLSADTSNLSMHVRHLFELDEEQGKDITYLQATVGVLLEMLVESGVLDADSVVARVEAELDTLERQQAAEAAAPRLVKCVKCSVAVPAGQTNMTAQGEVCQKCYVAGIGRG